MSDSPSRSGPQRIVVFGATGHLGQEVIARLESAPWSQAEIVGVVSEGSDSIEFESRGELLDAVTGSPALRAGDLVMVCTPGDVALDVVRDALRAQVPCIDCTGVMAEQSEVLMPVLATDSTVGNPAVAGAPLLAAPGATTLAWAPLHEGLTRAVGIERVVATVLQSASSLGRRGLVALSEESIALFNQSEASEQGPAVQPVAFDVIPSTAAESKTAAEIGRVFEGKLRVDVANVKVPAFVGEGASLAIELAGPLDEAAFLKTLHDIDGIEVVENGIGMRGLAPVEAGQREPTGPTLRDAAGAEDVLVGGIRADETLAPGLGWRVWLSYDPVRISAAHAVRLAILRFSEP